MEGVEAQTNDLQVGKCNVWSELESTEKKWGKLSGSLIQNKGNPDNQMKAFRLYLGGRKSH